MKTLRVLLLALGLAAGPVPAALAAAPLRLHEIAVSRFSRTADSRVRLELGHLGADRQFRVAQTHHIAPPPGLPDAVLGKFVVASEAWIAFESLGPAAVANFVRTNGGAAHLITGIPHYEVETSPAAVVRVAPVINLSTRGPLAAGGAPSLVGGFVVDGPPGTTRRVLLRAVGPSLRAFGVTDAAPNPRLTLHDADKPINTNDDWAAGPDGPLLADVAAQVGAFPLLPAGRDAALLVDLAPGLYTVAAAAEPGSAGGTAVIEIYLVP